MIFGGNSRDDRDRGSNPIVMLATIVLAPIAAMLIQMAISRQREFAADRGGADIAGTPTGLANALRHIDAAAKQIPLEANAATAHMFIIQPFTGGGMMNLFSSHPPTEARIKALMEGRQA
jgi:heat shock protein HtpX